MLTATAPAKINLTLAVHGRRADGYHLLESLVVFAGPADRVTLDTGGPVGLAGISGPFAAALEGRNLLSRTLELVASQHPTLRLGAVTLEKNLPVAAGIGGGSADAGVLLRLIREANPDYEAAVDWQSIALALGADVPVAMLACPAVMAGIGERVIPLGRISTLALVLVNPLVPVPATKTRDVFRALAAPRADVAPEPMLPPHDRAGLEAFITARGNDLTAAAIGVVPAIEGVLSALATTPECRLARLSGAGPTCFGLFDDIAAARSAAGWLAARHPGWWVSEAIVS